MLHLSTFCVLLSFCTINELVTKTVETLLSDDGFQIPSEEAASALATAVKLSHWLKESGSTKLLNEFSASITSQVNSCFGSSTLSLRTRKGRMWGAFHQLRTSKEFTAQWKTFLQESVGCTGCAAGPIFSQYTTYEVFKDLVRQKFKTTTNTTRAPDCRLTDDDQKALRYVAGYVCRNKLESSSTPNKDDMILTLFEFRGDGVKKKHDSEEWTNTLDWGGLWHVTDDVFTFFYTWKRKLGSTSLHQILNMII